MARKPDLPKTAGYIVHLDTNLPNADAQATLQAIARVRGVSATLAARRERETLRVALQAVLKSLG